MADANVIYGDLSELQLTLLVGFANAHQPNLDRAGMIAALGVTEETLLNTMPLAGMRQLATAVGIPGAANPHRPALVIRLRDQATPAVVVQDQPLDNPRDIDVRKLADATDAIGLAE